MSTPITSATRRMGDGCYCSTLTGGGPCLLAGTPVPVEACVGADVSEDRGGQSRGGRAPLSSPRRPRLDREEAADRLPSLSATVSVATTRTKAAMPFLPGSALALTEEPYNWSTERIGKLGDVTPKYVRDVKSVAARRRR